MQGDVSQIFYICPSLNLIKCRKSFMKKKLNLPVFVIELELGLK